MASFNIKWKTSAVHDLKKLDRQYVPLLISEVEKLSENPFPGQSRKLKGSESSYRLRVGDYRAIYQVNVPESSITVYHVRHRKDAYRR